MVTNDTIELLKECDAGIKMGIRAIDEVLDGIDNRNLKNILQKSKEKHKSIEKEIKEQLNVYGDSGKEPSAMAKSMSWLKTNVKMAMDSGNHTASDLITDGCNMGIKTLQRYLNEYEKADDNAKKLAQSIISTEELLLKDLKSYL